jgi:magnesium chelatase subunit D
MSARYPFSGIVGQEPMKRALVLNAINPRLGGVLIRGQKGTAKSTAARGLAALMPPLKVVDGCRFGCSPDASAVRCPECVERGLPSAAEPRPPAFVELPVGATEDRVIGTLDLERMLADGQRHFEPGLLARANRGLLYVDEVNLLPDHLVDTLLDAAAMGVNTVERDGVSFVHPAAFVLVGTMNPEEGDLRPQLLDRFALAVDVDGMPATDQRAEVVRRRIAYERDPRAFSAAWRASESAESARIRAAQALLPLVEVPDAMLELIARICTAFEVDGLRADIVTYKAAATLAAYAGRREVGVADVRQAAELALPHRRRRQPFDQAGLDHQRLDDVLGESARDDMLGESARDDVPPRSDPPPPPPPTPPPGPDATAGSKPPPRVEHERVIDAVSAPDVRLPTPPSFAHERIAHEQPDMTHAKRDLTDAPARHRAALVPGPRGRHVRSVATPVGPVDILATLRQAALRPATPRETARRETAQRPAARPTPDSPVVAGESFASHMPSRTSPPPSARHSPAQPPETPLPHSRDGFPSNMPSRTSPPPGARHGPAPRRDDLRYKLRAAPAGRLTLFVVDASGSMAARKRMALAKGAILRLLLRAYQTREQVALLAFRGAIADVLLPPTSSVHLASTRLRELPTGGRTPLALALSAAARLLHPAARRNATRSQRLVLISDGRANVPLTPGGDAYADALSEANALKIRNTHSVMIDTEDGAVRLHRAAALANALGASYLPLAPA